MFKYYKVSNTKIFRSHNRSNFEIYAFSFEKETSSNIWKKDVKHYFKEIWLISISGSWRSDEKDFIFDKNKKHNTGGGI